MLIQLMYTSAYNGFMLSIFTADLPTHLSECRNRIRVTHSYCIELLLQVQLNAIILVEACILGCSSDDHRT